MIVGGASDRRTRTAELFHEAPRTVHQCQGAQDDRLGRDHGRRRVAYGHRDVMAQHAARQRGGHGWK